MSKKVDWTGKGIFEENTKGGALKQRFMQLASHEEKVQKSQEEMAQMRPLLKSVLAWYMKNRKPITVYKPFPYETEQLVKSATTGAQTFRTVMAQAQPGSRLIFKSHLKSTSQFLFETENGEEVAIYTSDVLVGGPNGMIGVPNTGLNGLLYNTEVYETLLKLKENE